MTADYRVKVVDKSGAAAFGAGPDAGFLDDAHVNPFGEEHNRPGFASFTLHPRSANTPEATVLTREVQIYRDDTFCNWYVPTKRTRKPGRVDFQCRGLSWYLDRLHIGKADRQNFALNPEFEEAPDLNHWTAVNTTATVSTDQRVLGTQSAKLVQAAGNQDAYLSQIVNVTGTGIGSLFTVSAWFHILDAGWLGGAANKWGLLLTEYDTGVIQGSGVFRIDGKTQRGKWLRGETEVWVPPDANRDIEIRLYSPGGTIYWDAVSLTLMESLAFFDQDLADVVDAIVPTVQDPALDKVDLNLGANTTPIGVSTANLAFQYARHHNAGRELRNLTELGYCDISVEFGDSNADGILDTREVTVHVPDRGTVRNDIAADDVAVTAAELTTWTEEFDGERAANSVITLGQGDGPDREEGFAQDLAAFDGEVVLEEIYAAPAGVPIDALDALAAERVRVRKDPRTLQLVWPAEGIVGNLQTGDRVPVNIVDDTTEIDGTWRIIRWTVNPDKDSFTADTNVA